MGLQQVKADRNGSFSIDVSDEKFEVTLAERIRSGGVKDTADLLKKLKSNRGGTLRLKAHYYKDPDNNEYVIVGEPLRIPPNEDLARR